MVKERLSKNREKLEIFLQHLEESRQLRKDWMINGLDSVDLYFEDVDGDWLEKWGENDEESGYVELMTIFLESDDVIAVKVREKLQDKSISEVIEELELCLSQLEEVDRIRATENLLASGIRSFESNPGYADDEIELFDLAESLLDKLSEIFES